MLPPHWVVPPSGGAAWGRRRAETHEAAHRRGFRGVKRRARRIFASREAIGCVIRSSACCNPTTALQGIDRTCVTAPSPTPTLTRTSRRDRGRTAAESPTCVPLFFFPTHPPCLCGGVSGLRSGVDVISDARAAAAQHKQWRAQQTGGGIASRQQLHARTNGGNGRARIHSSCSSGGGGGSNSSHRLPLHWRRGAAHSASRLTPADWAHAPRGAAGDLICSNPP